MNCYDFEKNISAYIEGELKKRQKEYFVLHKKECFQCSEKVDQLSIMLSELRSLKEINTSSDFELSLQARINDYENKGPSIWEKILDLKPFGLEPLPALGFALSLVMITSASYLLLNQDGLPEINLDKIASDKNTSNFSPSIVPPVNESPTIADKDSSIQMRKNKTNNRIKLVGGK